MFPHQKILYSPPLSYTCYMSSTAQVLDLIIPVIFGEEYRA
jgi:hypothetical protein